MREREINKIAQMYLRYLNGPLGKGVMEHLKEGESFTIKAHDELLNITKTHNFVRLTYQIEATLEAGHYVFF